jgi:hypothetical protein
MNKLIALAITFLCAAGATQANTSIYLLDVEVHASVVPPAEVRLSMGVLDEALNAVTLTTASVVAPEGDYEMRGVDPVDGSVVVAMHHDVAPGGSDAAIALGLHHIVDAPSASAKASLTTMDIPDYRSL